ncbi:uncharacterized protein LOC141654823 [Silene latifolia]|uniref:uncharacterized protein LOC141654823 n=1 Tax=Silene latifolia TaxID=37657 RepID=UPI003D780A99
MDYWKVAKKVLRYLQGTKEPMLTYRRSDHLEVIAVFFSKNDKYSMGAKHMELKFLSVKEEVQKQRVSFEHIRTDNMVADPLTKGLSPKAFIGHVERMGVVSKALLL